MLSPTETSIMAVSLVLLLLCYFIPALIAYLRRHRKRNVILLLNLLTGWTAIGWVICAVWSSTPNVERRRTEPIRALLKHPERRKLAS